MSNINKVLFVPQIAANCLLLYKSVTGVSATTQTFCPGYFGTPSNHDDIWEEVAGLDFSDYSTISSFVLANVCVRL